MQTLRCRACSPWHICWVESDLVRGLLQNQACEHTGASKPVKQIVTSGQGIPGCDSDFDHTPESMHMRIPPSFFLAKRSETAYSIIKIALQRLSLEHWGPDSGLSDPALAEEVLDLSVHVLALGLAQPLHLAWRHLNVRLQRNGKMQSCRQIVRKDRSVLLHKLLSTYQAAVEALR